MLDFAHEDRLFPRVSPAAADGTRQTVQMFPGHDRLADLKAQIAAGTYLTDEKLDVALDRMISAQK